MFGLKVILKICQKTDVTCDYVEKVIVGDYGQKIMKYCLKVGYNILKYGISDLEDEHPDILSDTPSIVVAEKNKFIINLNNFVKANREIFLLEPEISARQTRNTVSVQEVVDTMFQVVKNYIDNFWAEVNKRIKLTDLSAGNTSYSEAPAESIFSVWARIISGREDLAIDTAVALVRVAMEGPVASTKNSFNLSKRALDNWPSHLGERFTTDKWRPGNISKTIAKIQKD